jgi:hypothetical protein
MMLVHPQTAYDRKERQERRENPEIFVDFARFAVRGIHQHE